MELPNVAPIRDIVSLLLHSSGVRGRRSVSCMLCSLPDSGKTVWMMYPFTTNDGVQELTTLTRHGFTRWITTNKRYLKVRSILIPDMAALLTGQRASVDTLVQSLMSYIYEGLREYLTYHIPQLDLPKGVRVTGNIVGGIVPSVYKSNKDIWAQTGFLRRFLPISYNYTPAQLKGIRKMIRGGRNTAPAQIELNRKVWGHEILVDEELVQPLASIVDSIILSLDVEPTLIRGNTFEEMLRTLVLAHALRDGRTVATGADVAAIIRLSKYMNYKMNTVPSISYDC